jgi:invasion protein IalB
MSKTARLCLGAAIAIAAFASAHAATKPTAKPAAKPAPAEAPSADPGPGKPLGSSVGGWTAYLAQNSTGKVCYVVAQPEKSQSAGVKRKTVMAMVTHRTEDHVANVVSFAAGYPLKEGADVQLAIGSDKFPLFASDDTAWARTAELDKAIVAALEKGNQAIVKAVPKKGHVTTDIYALSGFSQALARIDKACDVKR